MIAGLVCIAVAILSYLLGSLNFGVILSKGIEKDDVREHGSGNAGTTNMLRNYGKKLAIFTILGDMIKVAIAIGLSFLIVKLTNVYDLISEANVDADMLIKSFSGFFCVLGHIFPCFFKFKGGKGVATAGGMVFIVDWKIALILLTIFIIIVAVTKYVSLGSIIIALLYPILIYLFYKSFVLTLIASIFTLIVIVAHRSNIKKLINHSENKINLKKSK